MNNQYKKKSKEELQNYLMFKRRKNIVKPKKGTGSFNRAKIKKCLKKEMGDLS